MAILARVRAYLRLHRVLLLLIISFLFVCVGMIIIRTYAMTNVLRVTFLGVGQGDSILIETPTRTRVLIDGGPGTIRDKVDRYLPLFDRTLDLVIATHADQDHITGLVDAYNRYTVRAHTKIHIGSDTSVYDEYEAKKEGTEYAAFQGDTIDIGGGAIITILYPHKEMTFSPDETNVSSTAVLLSYKGYTFLLTGDLSVREEHHLLESGLLPRNITVLKAGHHGSKDSTGTPLLSYTNPSYVVVSAGKDNRYGHPHQELLDRVAKEESELLSTVLDGSITFIVRNEKLLLHTERSR